MERASIYLDSNVIIDIADGREDELFELILKSISIGTYCYPFAAEQISEITQPKKEDRNNYRLTLLGKISNNIYFEHSINVSVY